MKRHGEFVGKANRGRVVLTKQHIDDGMARNSNHCTIANAIKDAFPWASHVSVDLQTIRFSSKEKKERYIYLTPRSVQEHIIFTDQGMKEKIRPLTFELREGQIVVSGSDRLKKHNKSKTKKAKLKKVRGGTNIPVIVGGRTPPRMVGQRRAFGLRSLSI